MKKYIILILIIYISVTLYSQNYNEKVILLGVSDFDELMFVYGDKTNIQALGACAFERKYLNHFINNPINTNYFVDTMCYWINFEPGFVYHYVLPCITDSTLRKLLLASYPRIVTSKFDAERIYGSDSPVLIGSNKCFSKVLHAKFMVLLVQLSVMKADQESRNFEPAMLPWDLYSNECINSLISSIYVKVIVPIGY